MIQLTSPKEIFAIDEKIAVVDIHHRVDVTFFDHINRNEWREAMWPHGCRCTPVVRIYPFGNIKTGCCIDVQGDQIIDFHIDVTAHIESIGATIFFRLSKIEEGPFRPKSKVGIILCTLIASRDFSGGIVAIVAIFDIVR
ncbi:hypothetical protein D3C81_1174700 [compost metagenome]